MTSRFANGPPLGRRVGDSVAAAARALPARDARNSLPTLAAAIDSLRTPVQERGSLVILYLNFDRYAKVEEIYGWEKLDAVLDTTARELASMLAETPLRIARLAVSHINDDDFLLFYVPPADPPGREEGDDGDLSEELVGRLHAGIADCLEQNHGADVASLFDLYVGRALVQYDPKVRLERVVYRGIRTAASNAHNLEQRERLRLADDLRETLRTGAVYVDYHPIVNAADGEVFGYEALARGSIRSLRRPEVMFEVAAEAGLIWELSRLCRSRAIEGIKQLLKADELLFINVDPHDFTDPEFGDAALDSTNAHRIVIEITERTAIKDYPLFRERLRGFRDRGFRFAVDDAGSGYAGLGSIANLEPDFIKLDISLINGIDENFIKQDLVETLVRFANDQGAKVIAEGVEYEQEYEVVKALGVHLVQGFYLHRPQQLPDNLEGSVGGA
ncbi:MAG: EAL domain-containing protein [Gemmatimonadota bacterium]|nr:EAL domain-containing protein [Gemmatimonadota bacterium]